MPRWRSNHWPAAPQAFLEQTRVELEQRLAAAAYAELAHPTPASHQVQVSPAQLHALVYGIVRRALPAGRYLTRNGLRHSCHVVGVPEAVPYGVSAAVDAFLERLAHQHMLRIDPPDGRLRRGPAFNRWEATGTRPGIGATYNKRSFHNVRAGLG